MKHPTVFIMRGIPGSGKSAVAAHIAGERAAIASADHYFEKKSGGYRFDHKQLGAAHDHCKQEFLEFIRNKERCIVVDNTNVQRRDYFYYEKVARQNGYAVVTVVIEEQDPNTCYRRNAHGVPFETVQRMAKEFQR